MSKDNRIYTVVIEASTERGGTTIWQAMAPADRVTVFDGQTAADVARDTATNQNLAEGDGWRVRVWEGNDADTGSEPTAEHYANHWS